MINNQKYIDYLVSDYIKPKIDLCLNEDLNTNDRIIQEHYSNRFNNSLNFKRFQEYYFTTTGDFVEIDKDNFISNVKKYYSIQGVSSIELNYLEKHKTEIVELILRDKIVDIYFRFFYSLNGKNHGSFFTKIVHSVIPEKYCPVDIPIREFFNLKNENYYFSMLALSRAFVKWGNENDKRLGVLKKMLITETIKIFPNISASSITEKMNDIKILNIIFWSLSINHKNKTT
ncbi:MAG: hypothetical protein PHZ24_12425 [Bacteroidales bacterium]|nr:hypothetical protein [Bacteroidales bacterium]